MKRLYLRCNGGHYFVGKSCPFDGWGSAETVKLHEFVSSAGAQDVSIDDVAAQGFSAALMKRVVLIEFADEAATFEGLAPEYYRIHGKTVRLDHVPIELM